MRDYSPILVLLLLALGLLAFFYPEGATALLAVSVLSIPAVLAARKYAATDDKAFLTKLFLIALAARLAFGAFVYFFDFIEFFGGDALTYHYGGQQISGYWLGTVPANDYGYIRSTSIGTPGWGMNYFVALFYLLLGQSFYTAQSICAVFGAATAPLVYFCSQRIYNNRMVARSAAIAVALFPSFIIWSGQLMKDGLIVFLIVLAVTMVLVLQEKFSYPAVALLIFSLFGIISLRFYIFYMVAIAVAGSFVIGLSKGKSSIARRTVALVVIGLALTYLGVLRNASANFEKWGDLEKIQRSRQDLAARAESGFGDDIDVSTTEGAITTSPLGLAYLMLAPFPWEVSSLRQAITLPEVLLWWAMIPVMIYGIWYTIKNRLRSAFPALFFSLMLTIAYSIFQGNVGTAYRQRTQIQVFLFIFIAVGWTLIREHKADKRAMRAARERAFERSLQARAQ
jgi:4-amino-4-deoxy-L-arabinose transferase-like glycosyltransferase